MADMRPSGRCSLPAPDHGLNGGTRRPRARGPPMVPAQPLRGYGASLGAAYPTPPARRCHAPESHASLRAVEDDDRLVHLHEIMLGKASSFESSCARSSNTVS